jgi:6-methylsalicylate decarboxylase
MDARAREAARDGVDLALMAPSAALGLDVLPPAEGAALAEAWLRGMDDLAPCFRSWAPAWGGDLGCVDAMLDAGAVGVELPATALASPGDLDAVAPLLDLLERRDRALFIHPGPAGPRGGPGLPAWWAPVVAYSADLCAAWWAWAHAGRQSHPRLSVCFAALAGLAPLHGERRRARGGAPLAVDPRVFLESSSHGTVAIDAVVRVVGVDVVCHGSDLPYAAAPPVELGESVEWALHVTNPARLLGADRVGAASPKHASGVPA